MRVAVCQMRSDGDVERNLGLAERLLGEAADGGAELAALPEYLDYMGPGSRRAEVASPVPGPVTDRLATVASQRSMWVLAGGVLEAAGARAHDSSVLLDPDGEVAAIYRKIHLFDVDLGASGGAFRESATFAPGSEVVVADTPFGGLGLSVCYDVRFPELYRELAIRGARMIAVPSAFTPTTGRDHWEVLLRARAIECQAYLVAPAQCGQHAPDRSSYGRSMIVDPWGLVIARAGDRPQVIVADCDPAEVDRVREAIPALRNRRL